MKIAVFLITTIIIPALLGCLVTRSKESLALTWVKGYLVRLSVLFFPAVICAIRHTSLKTLVIADGVLVVLVIAFTALAGRFQFKTRLECVRVRFAETCEFLIHDLPRSLTLWAAIALIAAQMMIPVFMIHIDDDDATYVGMATAAVDTDTVLDYDPQNGDVLADLSEEELAKRDLGRYAISPLYAFYAAESRLTGMRPAVLCHTALPALLTLMAYIIFYHIGAILFDSRKDKIGLFLIILSVVHMSSYVSVYTAGTFLLLRIWQGKGQFAGILAPMLILLDLTLIRSKKIRKTDLLCLEAALIAAAVMTPIGNLLAVVGTGIALLVFLLIKREGRVRLICQFGVLLVIPVLTMAYYALFLR